MSKREVQLYEIVDSDGATVCFKHTIIQARQACHEVKGAKWKLTNVPLRPDYLATFLTDYAGGAG